MREVPPLFAALVDDAAMFPPGNATVPEAVAAHRDHRRSWFAPLVGPLVVRDRQLDELRRVLDATEPGGRVADLEAELLAQRRMRGALDQPLVLGPHH